MAHASLRCGTVDCGWVRFDPAGDGLRVRVRASLPLHSAQQSSLHGLHVHEFGSDERGCTSMGGHYNPGGVDHPHHPGDLGNVVSDASGHVSATLYAPSLSLLDVVGRGVVLHVNEDDLGAAGTPSSLSNGSSGGRLACGPVALRDAGEADGDWW